MRAGATDFLGRPIAPERLIEALDASCRPPPAVRRAGAGGRKARARPRARAADRRDSRVPLGAGRRRQGRAQPPADPDHRRAAAPARRPSPGRSTPPACARKGPLVAVDCKARPGQHHRQRAVRPRSRRLPRRLPGRRAASCSRPMAAPCCSTTSPLCRSKPRKRSTACSPPAKSARSAATAAIRSTSALIATSSRPAARRFPCAARRAGGGDHRARCRRCASAAATSRRSPATCWRASPSRG